MVIKSKDLTIRAKELSVEKYYEDEPADKFFVYVTTPMGSYTILESNRQEEAQKVYDYISKSIIEEVEYGLKETVLNINDHLEEEV